MMRGISSVSNSGEGGHGRRGEPCAPRHGVRLRKHQTSEETDMLRFLQVAFAGVAVLVTASCSSDMVTGGPLIREGEPTGIIEVANGSGGDINVVLISDCGASTYGLDRLGDASIPPGGSYRFTVSAGCWDVSAGSTGAMTEGRQRLNVSPNQVTRVTFE
jgi:hypothetical protein